MNFIRQLPSFDMFLNTSQTTRATGNHWTHHSTFSHYHSRPPESSAGVIHIKYTLTDQFNKHESTHHTAFKSDNISNTNIHHNIPLHFDISALDRHT